LKKDLFDRIIQNVKINQKYWSNFRNK
jgi:hypothetical protein